MELKRLRYFIALAEEMHFGKAARRLRVSQPALSKQISALEKNLNTPLLTRGRRHIQLTEAGNAIVDEVRLLLAKADHIETVAQTTSGRHETLSIGVPPWIGPWGIEGLLSRLAAQATGFSIRMSQTNVPEQIAALRDGRLNAGLILLPFKDPALALLPVARERFVLAIHHGHRLGARRRIAMCDLAEEPMVSFSYEYAPAYCDLLAALFREAGFAPRINHWADGTQALLAMAAAGLGAAVIPQSLSRLHAPGLSSRPFADPGATFETALAYRAEAMNAPLRQLVDTLRAINCNQSIPTTASRRSR